MELAIYNEGGIGGYIDGMMHHRIYSLIRQQLTLAQPWGRKPGVCGERIRKYDAVIRDMLAERPKDS